MAQLDRFCLLTFPEQTQKGGLCRELQLGPVLLEGGFQTK
jgi:hypothetical protein